MKSEHLTSQSGATNEQNLREITNSDQINQGHADNRLGEERSQDNRYITLGKIEEPELKSRLSLDLSQVIGQG